MEKDEKSLNFLESMKSLGDKPPLEGVEQPMPSKEEIGKFVAEKIAGIARMPEFKIAMVADFPQFVAQTSFLAAYVIAEKYGLEVLKEYMLTGGLSQLIDGNKL